MRPWWDFRGCPLPLRDPIDRAIAVVATRLAQEAFREEIRRRQEVKRK